MWHGRSSQSSCLRGTRAVSPFSFFMAFYLLKINEKVDPGDMKQVHHKMKKLQLSVKLCKQEETNAYNS